MTTEKLNLPDNYLLWLDSLEAEAYAEFEEREWEIASREELQELLEKCLRRQILRWQISIRPTSM